MTTRTGSSEDVSPGEAYQALTQDAKAMLVDVRTRPEWSFVGVPDLGALEKDAVFLEWQAWPTMAVSVNFLSDLAAAVTAAGGDSDSPLYFICRSGARSGAAAQAAAAAGFAKTYNVAGGFEGRLDADGRRGSLEGWKADGLPWRQS